VGNIANSLVQSQAVLEPVHLEQKQELHLKQQQELLYLGETMESRNVHTAKDSMHRTRLEITGIPEAMTAHRCMSLPQ
jgi:hypothetical protein